MAEVKLKLKERWVDIKTNKVIQSIVTEESIHIDDDLDQEASIVGEGLSKSEMFDFILNNAVSIDPDNTTWTKYHEDGTEEKFKKKYTVSINGHGMSGFDLEDAINYYVREIQK